MKTFKTFSKMRETYTYIDAMGRKVVLKPGDVDPISGAILTEEMIKQLHRFDDNEVYNNVKNSRSPILDWVEPLIEEWEKDHPDEVLPTRTHISLDSVLDDEDEDDADKGLMAAASLVSVEKEDPMVERLHEVIEMLRPEQKELYQRIVINGEQAEDIAEEEGVDPSAIRHRMERIKKSIKKNF